MLNLNFDSLIPDMSAKYGYIYTKKFGFEESKAIEVWEKNGWSIDLGRTETQLFAGIAKDIYENKLFSVDVGAGLTTAKQFYTGIHIKF